MASPVWEQKSRENLKSFLKKNQKVIQSLYEKDANEEDTRTFVNDMLVSGLGYDRYEELTSEMRIQHEFADIGIRIAEDEKAILEVKRVKLLLKEQHLRQVKTYAANKGLPWAILTNGRIWQVYRISDTTPITDHLLFSVDILAEVPLAIKVEKLWMLSREAMKRDVLSTEWKLVSALSPESIKKALLSEAVLKSLRTQLRLNSKQLVDISKLKQALVSLLKDFS